MLFFGLLFIQIDCKVVVYYGWEDFFVLLEDVVVFVKEFFDVKVDWYFIVYGYIMYVFMVEGFNDLENGIVYNECFVVCVWVFFGEFLLECFDGQ